MGSTPPASPSPQRAGRKSREVMIWKLVEYGGLILYTAVIPRQMGPELYGRFAALLSFISLLSMGSALGAQASFARFIPEYETRGEPERTKT